MYNNDAFKELFLYCHKSVYVLLLFKSKLKILTFVYKTNEELSTTSP